MKKISFVFTEHDLELLDEIFVVAIRDKLSGIFDFNTNYSIRSARNLRDRLTSYIKANNYIGKE